ncbi:MAG TPA: RNA polymerase sigma-70 factor [Puia sp.]|nr:RNA polymerase sigma-70 factor [Puia sp.]
METDLHIEQQWLRELLDGSEAAFRAIYDAHERRIYHFALYLTKSPAIAEEVVQEAFIRLWERRSMLAADSQLGAFLKKIVQNLVLDLYRKAARDRSLLSHIREQREALERQGSEPLLQKELQRAYREALEQLPPQQRAVFLLSREEQLSYQQIADHLGLSRNTVRNHMSEAIRSVRQYIHHHTGLACLLLAFILQEKN